MSNTSVHIAEGDTPMDPGYIYDSTGVGVRRDLVDAVLAKWASVSPYGTPSATLASVDQGALNKVDNIARMAVAATLEALGLVNDDENEEGPGPTNEEAFDRIRDFILAAAEADRPPADDWRAALHDVATELEEIAYGRLAHPDSVASAELAMSSLSGVWLDDEAKDRLYLGQLEQQ